MPFRNSPHVICSQLKSGIKILTSFLVGKKKETLTSGRPGYLLYFVKVHASITHKTGREEAPKVLFPHQSETSDLFSKFSKNKGEWIISRSETFRNAL